MFYAYKILGNFLVLILKFMRILIFSVLISKQQTEDIYAIYISLHPLPEGNYLEQKFALCMPYYAHLSIAKIDVSLFLNITVKNNK